jgi:hypothetical protein
MSTPWWSGRRGSSRLFGCSTRSHLFTFHEIVSAKVKQGRFSCLSPTSKLFVVSHAALGIPYLPDRANEVRRECGPLCYSRDLSVSNFEGNHGDKERGREQQASPAGLERFREFPVSLHPVRAFRRGRTGCSGAARTWVVGKSSFVEHGGAGKSLSFLLSPKIPAGCSVPGG